MISELLNEGMIAVATFGHMSDLIIIGGVRGSLRGGVGDRVSDLVLIVSKSSSEVRSGISEVCEFDDDAIESEWSVIVDFGFLVEIDGGGVDELARLVASIFGG